jgi:hypothetical protein
VPDPDALVPALLFFPILLIPFGIGIFVYGKHWYRLSYAVAEYRGAIASKNIREQ